MKEIRKQRKVRGIAGALRGCARPEGWSFGDASFRGYAIDFQHAISFVARAQTANSWRNDLDGGGFGRDQDAASLLTTWIVRRFPQPRATLRWLFINLNQVLLASPEKGPFIVFAGQIVMTLFLGRKLIV